MQTPLHATLTEGSVANHLKVMAIPMVWGLLATMLLGVIEAFFIAQLGPTPLAALGFCFPIIMVITSLAIGLGAGASSAVARAIGEGDQQMARRLATDAMSLTAIVSIAVCLLGWLSLEPLFIFLGAAGDVLPLIRQYMSIWYFSAPCLMVPMVGLAALRALGMSQAQGYLMSAAAVLNLALDPVLIFGLGPVPAMGLQGAAIAALITRLCMLLAAIYVLHWRYALLVSPGVQWQQLRLSWKIIVHVGIPAMCANAIVPFASALIVKMMADYGTDAVAGLGIAMRIEPLMLIVFYALSGVIGPFFGQNCGAGKMHRLSQAVAVLVRFSLGFGLLVALLLWFFAEQIVSAFGGHREVMAIAVSYFALVPISYGAYGIVMSINAAFNGLGRPWPAMILSGGRVLFVYLPLAYLCQLVWQAQGIFIATTATNIAMGLWAWWWICRYIRQLSAQVE